MFTWNKLDGGGYFPLIFNSMRDIPYHKVRVFIVTNHGPEYFYERYFCQEFGDFMPSSWFEKFCNDRGAMFWNTLDEYKTPHFKDVTQEIIERLSCERTVFGLFDHTARVYDRFVDHSYSSVIYTKYRLFSTINDKLNHLCKDTIEWRMYE